MNFLLLITTVICLVKGEDVHLAFQRAMAKYAAKDGINLRESPEMTKKRFRSFAKFHAMVEEVNNDDSLPYRAADNFMSILTEEERKLHLGLNMTGKLTYISNNDDTDNILSEIPEKRDFSLIISDIKDQQTCGSCWTFGATAAIEGEIYFKTGKKKVSLSEQEFMECVNRDDACYGGWPTHCFEYSKDNDRIAPNSAYPYLNRDRFRCHTSATTPNALVDNNVKITGTIEFKDLGDVKLLEKASTHIISVAIYANDYFVSYDGGLFVSDYCNHGGVNHAVNVVGYGKDSSSGHKYWKLRNSWGKGWGEKGYMRIDREKRNMCMISTYPHYPKVECRNGNCVAPNPDDGDSSDDEKDEDEDKDEDKDDEKDDDKEADKEFNYDEACFSKRGISWCNSKRNAHIECTKKGVPKSKCIVARLSKKCYVSTIGAESDRRYMETSYKCKNGDSDGVQSTNLNDKLICYDEFILTPKCKGTRDEALEICKAKVEANKCIIIFNGKCFYATNGWKKGTNFVHKWNQFCSEG